MRKSLTWSRFEDASTNAHNTQGLALQNTRNTPTLWRYRGILKSPGLEACRFAWCFVFRSNMAVGSACALAFNRGKFKVMAGGVLQG